METQGAPPFQLKDVNEASITKEEQRYKAVREGGQSIPGWTSTFPVILAFVVDFSPQNVARGVHRRCT